MQLKNHFLKTCIKRTLLHWCEEYFNNLKNDLAQLVGSMDLKVSSMNH